MTETIDLSELTQSKVRLLSGHPRGLDARALFDMDRLDEVEEGIEIVAPKNLEAITTSFVQGFFSGSLAKLESKDQLIEHYKLNISENLKQDFLQGIDRLLIQRQLAKNI